MEKAQGRRRTASGITAIDTPATNASGAQSADRAIDILLCFTHDEPVLPLHEIAQRTGLSTPTAHRLIRTLVNRGMMQQHSDRRYQLGPRLYALGIIARSHFTLANHAAEAVAALAADTGETIMLGQADFSTLQVIFLDSRPGRHPLSVRAPSRARPLLPAGPLGRSLLAALSPSELGAVLQSYASRGDKERKEVEAGRIQRQLQQFKSQGYSVDDQEYARGVTSVSSWIEYGNPTLIGAIGMLAPSDRLYGAKIEQLGRQMRDIAIGLSFPADRERALGA